MMKSYVILAGAMAAALLSSAAIGGSHADKALADAVKARKAQMQLYAFNLGQLGDMAKGVVPYDAAAAKAAAYNLAALTAMDQSRLWPQGSDEMGVDGTRALPAIWENGADVMAKSEQMTKAAGFMAAEAGNGLEALQAKMGDVGAACGACHKAYRAPAN